MGRKPVSNATSFSRSIILSRSALATSQRIPDRVICSVYEGKSAIDIKVGLCFFNLATSEIIMSTILDSQTYIRTIHKIHVFEPFEILVPQQYLSASTKKLVAILKSNIGPDIKIVGFDKKHFNDAEGLETIEKFAFEKDLSYLKQELGDKYHALRALAAGMKYMRRPNKVNQMPFRQFRFRHEAPESTMFIDTNTIKSLQLTESVIDKNGASFMKFLNSTLTKMGERVLRNNILQPLTDKDSIIMRLESVKELVDNDSLLVCLTISLKGLKDLDKLFAALLLCKNSITPEDSAQKINNIILVKQAVTVAIEIGNYLEDSNCTLLQQVRDICKDEIIIETKTLIDEYINEDCYWASGALDIKNQRIHSVKAGRNGLLDVSRQIYKFVVDEVVAIVENLGEVHGLDIEQAYNSQRGFYLKIKNYEDISSIPEIFINRKEKQKFLECTTLDITKCNARLDDSVSEILIASDQVIENLIEKITKFVPNLFMLGEALAVLDLIQCFASNASKRKYICPEISDMLTLKASRHPIMETLVRDFVANDVCSIKDTSRVQVITGTNMSGKSIYLRQVALLSIMVQIGSFVPADYAVFPLFNSLKARICVDNFASTTSSFVTEMKDMVCVLEDVDEKSLVIIDELGRGSSLNDGLAISLAICEHLVSTDATVFITTHFHELSKILGTRPCVVQNHMSASPQEEGLKMNYRVVGGITKIKRYGVKVAKKFFERKIIERANVLAEKLENSSKSNLGEEEQMEKNRRVLNLVKVLEYVVNNEEVTKELLLEIQTEFLS